MRTSEDLANTLFDEAIAPLAAQLREEGRAPCFPMGPDVGAQTYFSTPASCMLGADDFQIQNGGYAEGVIEALVQYWQANGDEELAALGPRLMEIAAALQAENEAATGEVNPLCYALF